MPNRLVNESSPYLLQHKDNPVEWYPWGEEALDRARTEEKPIFLSIGYAACHWCHVMEHESFEDPAVAELMNRHFINIKVDREERPDLDTIYMNAVVAMTGHGGWPMSVFLTPGLEPFYGGTYFPPAPRYNMPAFREILTSVARAWSEDRERVEEIGSQLHERLKSELTGRIGGGILDPAALERASVNLAQGYDWANGGWGNAPKFPQAMAIEFLTRRAFRGDRMAGSMLAHALHSMALGGMYDLVGGGFHRYSVDDIWLVPHFEKMLYDNALLARAYLRGFIVTGKTQFREVCTQTIDFIRREMTHPEGGFFSSLDADSEGEEGSFYLWSVDGLKEALPDPDEFELLRETCEIDEAGNFEGKIILRLKAVGTDQGQRPPPLVGWFEAGDDIRRKLLAARASRERPGTDDKILTAWNGLMLTAVSEAARYLNRTDYLDMATRNAEFLLEELHLQGRLKRAWRDGSANVDGFLEDYASLALGLLSLYQTDPNPRWFTAAHGLIQEMLEAFDDQSGGFFDTRSDQDGLLFRPRDVQDNATPSGNALAATALLTIAALDGDQRLREKGERPLGSLVSVAERYPTAFSQWLTAMDMAIGPTIEVALVGPPGGDPGLALTESLHAYFHPNLVSAQVIPASTGNIPGLLEDRPSIDGRPSAYVCQDFVCKEPVTDPVQLREQLASAGCILVPS